MTQFLASEEDLPLYIKFPYFLLDLESLSETAKILYAVLLNRGRLSIKNHWRDKEGHIYIIFPIEKLAETLHKSPTTIKLALSALEREDLVVRKHQGPGLPNRIYVKIPVKPETDRKLTPIQAENCPADSQKTVFFEVEEPSGSKIDIINNEVKTKRSNAACTAYGTYKNVFLTFEEITALKHDIPNYEDYVERLSLYMASSGKHYKNHAATIRSWALHDNHTITMRTYEYTEDESL